MHIDRMGPDEAQRCWPWLTQLLAPSIAVDATGSLETVHDMLLCGDMGLATVHVPNGAGILILHPGIFDGKFCLWVPYVVFHTRLGPKHWLRTIRAGMAHLVTEARKAGCAEVRIGGRDYSRIFPDFERFDDQPNRLRKVL